MKTPIHADLQGSWCRLACLLFTWLACSGLLHADRAHPGSLLIFSEFDNREGALTLLTVTNSNELRSVDLRFTYVSAETCERFIKLESLDPADQISLFTNVHHPEGGWGYVIVEACEGVRPIRFDWLVGTQSSLSAMNGLRYSLEPFAFRAGAQLAQGDLTDLDSDGLRDFDGREYELLPNRLLFPRYFAQTPGWYDTDLILISLTGAADFIVDVRFLSFNDNSENFTSTSTFTCWQRRSLWDHSALFRDSFVGSTNHDPNEVLGMPNLEAGWFQLEGFRADSLTQSIDRPAVLAALVTEFKNGSTYATLPFEWGTRPGGALIEFGQSIDLPAGELLCEGNACPCGNNVGIISDGGCRNSSGAGARLASVGTNHHATDDLSLVVSQAPASASGFFLQGATLVNVPFGDGRLCVGPPTRRLQFAATDSNGEAQSSVSLASFANPSDTVHFQYWFREPGAAGPCGNSSNLSNAYRVIWN